MARQAKEKDWMLIEEDYVHPELADDREQHANTKLASAANFEVNSGKRLVDIPATKCTKWYMTV